MTSKILSYALLHLALALVFTNGEPIMGGKEIHDPTRFPYVALIRIKGGERACSGSIIDERHILTSAACLQDDKADYEILVGDVQPDSPKMRRLKVESMQAHKEFKHRLEDEAPFVKNDIGLIRVTENIVPSESVRFVGLPTEDNPKHLKGGVAQLVLLGWGITDNKGTMPQRLNKVLMKVFPSKQCREAFTRLGKSQFCTFGQGAGSCDGDSGGPVIYSAGDVSTDIQVGIHSHNALPCGTHPDVHTKVFDYLGWIEATKKKLALAGNTLS